MSLCLSSQLQFLHNIRCMTGICLLPIRVIYSWQTSFRAESGACWKYTYMYTEYEKASMSVVRELTSCYLTMLNKLMTSIKDDSTSPNILSRVYQTVVHGSVGFTGRFSGIQLVLGFWSVEQNLRKEYSCLTSQEISRLVWNETCY